MKLRPLHLLLALLITSTAQAQVTELWTSGLKNTPATVPVLTGAGWWYFYAIPGLVTNYSPHTLTVDSTGETIVAGQATVFGTVFNDFVGAYGIDPGSAQFYTCVAKFDAQGNKLWEYETPDTLTQNPFSSFRTVVQTIDTDAAGDVYFFTRFPFDDHPYTVIKLAANDGHELWRNEVAHAAGSLPNTSPAALKVDAAGNATFTGIIFSQDAMGNYSFERFITRYAADGSRLWYQKLPGDHYDIGDENGLKRSLVLTPDGGAIVVGSYSTAFSGFAAKLDSNGQYVWLKLSDGKDKLPMFTSVCINSQGNICASGEYHTVFSSKGVVLGGNSNQKFSDFYGQVTLATPKGEFLLMNQYFITALNPVGRFDWFAVPSYNFNSHILGMMMTSDGSLVTVADDLNWVKYDLTGQKIWNIQTLGHATGNLSFQAAPDGTARILTDKDGIGILSLSVQ